jgi:two-component system sensor histidine kinase HydH
VTDGGKPKGSSKETHGGSDVAPPSDPTPQSDPFRSFAPDRRHVHELSAIHRIGRLIAEQLDLPSVLTVAVRHLSEATGGANAFILLLDEDDVLRSAATSATGPIANRIELPLSKPSIAAHACRENRPVLVRDVGLDPRADRGLVDHFRHTTILAVPLRARGETVGCVVLAYSKNEGTFDDNDVEHTVAIGNQLAIAIANARLIHDLKRSYAELERAQQTLVEKERLAVLGELSAVVAHEVRNPLAILWNSLGALRRLLRPTGEVATLLDIMAEESNRLNRLVGDLLDYARPLSADLRDESLFPIVEDALSAARATAPERDVRVELVVPRTLPPIAADARLLRQALLNLVANAIQATPDDGAVRIEAVAETPTTARIDVIDAGEGFPPDALARLFQPFFTTKPTGTGLGLALVKRIVEAHHGTVEARANDARGAIFTVRLPFA